MNQERPEGHGAIGWVFIAAIATLVATATYCARGIAAAAMSYAAVIVVGLIAMAEASQKKE